MSTPARKWQLVLSPFGTPARPNRFAEEPLWLGRSAWLRAAVWLPTTPSLVVLSAKRSTVDWWWEGGQVPQDIGLIHTPLPADPRSSQLVGKVLPPKVPVAFVGDLDPFAIVQYVELRRTAPFRQRLRFGGVDSAWLQAVRPRLRPQVPFERLRIQLSAEEVRVLRMLEQAVLLERLVGPEAAALLRSGFKIELEGTTNPTLFRNDGKGWAFQLLRRAVTGRRRSRQRTHSLKAAERRDR
jgi:hypothetical protein